MNISPNNHLDRLWAATQPEEPPTEVFDKLWAEVSAKASEPEPPVILSYSGWKRWGTSVAIFAQAAALLIAGFLALNRPSPKGVPAKPPVEVAQAPILLHDIRVEEGQTGFVSIDAQGRLSKWELRPQVPESETDMVAIEMDVLSFMESQP